MKKTFLIVALLMLTACNAAPSGAVLDTAVAQTLTAIPAGQLEVTRVVKVVITATPGPTNTPTPTLAATATPTITPTPLVSSTPTVAAGTPQVISTPGGPLRLNLGQFLAKYVGSTGLQKKVFLDSLKGKVVSWSANVQDVLADGTVIIQVPDFVDSTIVLNGVPMTSAQRTNKNQFVDFTGTIDSFTEGVGIQIVLVNAKITGWYEFPTATPVTPGFNW